MRLCRSILFILAALPAALQAGDEVDQQRTVSSDGVVEIQNTRGAVKITGWEGDGVRIRGELDDLATGLGTEHEVTPLGQQFFRCGVDVRHIETEVIDPFTFALQVVRDERTGTGLNALELKRSDLRFTVIERVCSRNRSVGCAGLRITFKGAVDQKGRLPFDVRQQGCGPTLMPMPGDWK